MAKKQSEYIQLNLLDTPVIGDWVQILPLWAGSKAPYIGKTGQIIRIETNGNPVIKIPGGFLVSMPESRLKKTTPPDESA